MISVIASIRVKERRLTEFLEIFKSNIAHVKAEEGCLEYFPAVDIDSSLPAQHLDANVVTVIEKWQTIDDLKAHIASPHMASYREKVEGMVESVSLKVLKEA